MEERKKGVTREEWYSAQKFQADVIKELKDDFKEFKDGTEKVLAVIGDDIKKILVQTTQTNGRVNGLEEWSDNAKKFIESNGSAIGILSGKYKVDKARIWVGLSVFFILGATIIGLGVLVVQNTIHADVKTSICDFLKEKCQ